MYFISKRLKKRHNIVDERQSLYEGAETWVKALNGRKFMGECHVLSIRATLSDCSVHKITRRLRREFVPSVHRLPVPVEGMADHNGPKCTSTAFIIPLKKERDN